MKTPKAYIIAGPNGAGKTTFAREFLPRYARCVEFLNADYMAQGLSPFAPAQAAFAAGRLVLERMTECVQRRVDFGFETTLSGKTYRGIFETMKRRGYQLHLYFLWLPNVEMAIARVANRVAEGGHDIPEPVIRRRFDLGLNNLFSLYRPLLDSWMIFDNSDLPPKTIAAEERGRLKINLPEVYKNLVEDVGGKQL
jgi:predicted ABC-type ATPase